MYWWNVSKLAEDFREGRVDEKERFKYYLATFVALTMAVQLFYYFGSTFSIEGLISAAVNLTVTIMGIMLCYGVNKSGDNTDFITRVICLGWPVGIRLLVILSALILVFGLGNAIPAASLGPESFRSAIPDKVWEWWNDFFRSPFCGILFFLLYYGTLLPYLAFVANAEAVQKALRPTKTEWSVGKVALGILGGIGIVVIAMLYLTWMPSLVREGRLEKLLSSLLIALI